MDDVLIKYYRKLLKDGFRHSGTIENPTVFLNSVGERLRICAHAIHNYIHLYLVIEKDVIKDIKYLCQCTPATNIAVEVLCGLVKGKTLEEAELVTTDRTVQPGVGPLPHRRGNLDSPVKSEGAVFSTPFFCFVF
jgi:NifU-like protein involved in Fe-S cluster formation